MNMETSSKPWDLISNTLKGLLFWFRLARTMVLSVMGELKNLDLKQRTSIRRRPLSQTHTLSLWIREACGQEVGGMYSFTGQHMFISQICYLRKSEDDCAGGRAFSIQPIISGLLELTSGR